MVATDELLTVGENFSRYHVEGLLGRGGSGTVYLARELNPHLERQVALKVLDPALSGDQTFRERFLREALTITRLGPHEGIISVHDAGEDRGLLWIAMQYVEGTDLHALLDQRGRLDPRIALAILGKVARALDTIHAAGVVHRDVKPRNILVSPDLQRVVLTDFGLSKLASSTGNSLTNAGQFVGTLECAAPEQINGAPVDASTDVYALGCVLFRMLTGRAPFDGGLDAVITGHLSHRVPSVSAFVDDLNAEVDEVLRKAMAKRPEDRYRGAAEFVAAFERALPARDQDRTIHDNGSGPRMGSTSVPPPPPEPTPPPTSSPPTSSPPTSSPPTWSSTTSSPPTSTPHSSSPPTSIPPAPNGSSRVESPTKRRRAWPLAVLVLLVLIIATVAWLLGRADPFPDAEEQGLLDLARASFRDTCEREATAGNSPDVLAAITCGPAGEASSVSLRRLESREAMNRVFRDDIDATPVEAGEFSCLTGSTNAVSEFVTSDDLVGQVACYRDGGGSFVTWTVDELRIVGAATSDNRFDADLIAWWADWYDVTITEPELQPDEEAAPEPDPESEPPPFDAEAELLGYVPSGLADGCAAVDPLGFEGEVATVRCAATDEEPDVVEYVLFDGNATMALAYNDFLALLGVEQNSATEGQACPSERPWSTEADRDVELGRLLCGVRDDTGATLMVWTDDRLSVLTVAADFEGGGGDALIEWWSTDAGGPIP